MAFSSKNISDLIMAVKHIINKFNYERKDDMKAFYQTIRRRQF